MSLTREDRIKILKSLSQLVPEKHINVANPGQDYLGWVRQLETRSPNLIAAASDRDFESGVQALLAALGSSHTAFFRVNGDGVPAPHAIHATLRAIETDHGPRWMFLDVFEDGVAHRAGIRPGRLMVALDGDATIPPRQPKFKIGANQDVEIADLRNNEIRHVTLEIPNRAAKGRPPMVEPRSIAYRMVDSEVGLLKVASFPGAVGQSFAKSLDAAVADLKRLGCTRLIVDLRGNLGGGLGSLRLMSYLAPGKLPIGHSLTRRRLQQGYDKTRLVRIGKIPSGKVELLLMAFRFKFIQKDRSMILVTEGLGPQPFHDRIVILINEHSHSAAEMVASFARENRLATLVGTKTAGEVLGGANFKLAKGYRLRMPVAGWYTWSGDCIEGKGVEPDARVEMTADSLASGEDRQLTLGIEVARGLGAK